LVKRHPEANLTADYVAGMSDHVNAIKATFLLLDDYTASVQNQSAGNFVLASPSEYGVASYNGGVTRIARSIKNFGAQWSDSRSDQINILQAQVTAQENKVNSLTQQIKKAKKKADKDRLTKERQQEQQSLDGLRGQLDTIKASTLRDETIGYVGKIRRLMPMVTVR
jgi:outer membrane murein-binding lipoprotein Lpp